MFHFNTEELTLEERRQLVYCHPKKSAEDVDYMSPYDLDKLNIPTRRLNVLLYQRSVDSALGLPFNITSYCLLLAMVAHCVDMVPGVFTHTYGDLHIYTNHLEGVKEQLKRCPMDLPKLWLNPDKKDLFSFTSGDIKLIDYKSHPTIKFTVAV
jgi:thymidylate synthase